MWLSPKTGKYVTKDVGDDFGAALDLFAKIKASGRKGTTLRSMNVGFPPPRRITEYEFVEVIRRRGKKVRVTSIVNLMDQYNDEGAWWCPYCVKIRKFVQRTIGLKTYMYCPACGISSRDGHVKRHNPKALVVEMHRKPRIKRDRGRRIRRSA